MKMPRSCRCAQADHDFRLHGLNFRLKPWHAGADFHAARLFVDAPPAAFSEFEMLNGIGDVSLATIHARGFERAIE